ncbi:MAG: FAD-dependent oxidoreductase [Patescibacteria group bacterium]
MKYDVIIIGAGSAGLSAAIFASRRNLKTLLISEDIGGQATNAGLIENYPGVEAADGATLMMNFLKQAQRFGAEFKGEEAIGLTKKGNEFLVKTNNGEYLSSALVLSSGLSHRHLGVPGEEKFVGRGVAYCANCDAPLYKNKTVAVVGGGNSALDAALMLAQNSPKVYLIHRREIFRGEEILINQVLKNKAIEILYDSAVKEIKGENKVNQIIVEQKGKNVTLNVEGVFVEIGYEVRADFLAGLVKQDEKNQIIVDHQGRTSLPGVFAAGDVTDTPYKQLVISAGEGAKAALACHQYLQAQGKTKNIFVDWGK